MRRCNPTGNSNHYVLLLYVTLESRALSQPMIGAFTSAILLSPVYLRVDVQRWYPVGLDSNQKRLPRRCRLHPVISLLEEKGLSTQEAIEAAVFHRWSIQELEGLEESLVEAVQVAEKSLMDSVDSADPLSSFTFVASLTLAGSAGCVAPFCRAGKAQLLARYAALYADRVITPLQLSSDHKGPVSRTALYEHGLRMSLAGTLYSIWEMRPAIEAGMVALIIPEIHFCDDCAEAAMRKLRRFRTAAAGLEKANENRFSVTYDWRDPAPRVTIHGPAEFMEHGQWIRVFHSVPSWIPKDYQKKSGIPLPKTVVRKSGVVKEIFRDTAAQVGLHEVLSFRYNAKTLTSNPGELSLLSRLDPKGGKHRETSTSLSRLTHSIPLLGDFSLATAVRIRKEEPDAFLVYRGALTKIVREAVKESGTLTEERAVEIVADILQPKVAKIRQLEATERTRASKKSKVWLGVTAAALTLGFFKGLTPTEYSLLGSSLFGLVDSLTQLKANPNAIRNENFYYLLRLTQ
jgi:hypothetical protein